MLNHITDADFNKAYLSLLVEEISRRSINLIDGDLKAWLKLAYILAKEADGYEHFCTLSKIDRPDVKERDLQKAFGSASRQSHIDEGIGPFVRLCKEKGIDVARIAGEVARTEGCSPSFLARHPEWDRYHAKTSERDRFHTGLHRQFTTPIRKVISQAPAKPVLQEPTMLLDPQLVRDCYMPLYSVFCQALIQRRVLSREQMEMAAALYRIGACKNRDVIFWQIDEQQRVRDGKIMAYAPDAHRVKKYDSVGWVGNRLSSTGKVNPATGQPYVPADWQHTHCLFGLHLLAGQPDDRPVAIVESEKTAIICSQLLCHLGYLWMATGSIVNLTPQYLLPLGQRREIRLFPDLDGYDRWRTRANELVCPLSRYLTIDTFLEEHATPQLRAMKADLADYFILQQAHLNEMIADNPAVGELIEAFDATLVPPDVLE